MSREKSDRVHQVNTRLNDERWLKLCALAKLNDVAPMTFAGKLLEEALDRD